MRWRTYDRLCAELMATEELHDKVFVAKTRRFMTRIKKQRQRRQ